MASATVRTDGAGWGEGGFGAEAAFSPARALAMRKRACAASARAFHPSRATVLCDRDGAGRPSNTLMLLVPATGLEPVRSYPLEPESSASANSATRAQLAPAVTPKDRY